MHPIIRGFKVTAYGKIKSLAATVSSCSFHCFGLDELRFITSSALSRNGEILFTLIEGIWPKVGQLATQSWKERLREPVASQHCLFMASAEHGARLTQRSPEARDGGGPHACRGLPPSGTRCHCAGSLSWETQGNVLRPNLTPTCFIIAENNPFKTALNTGCNYRSGGATKLGKVSRLQSLVESLFSQHIIKS